MSSEGFNLAASRTRAHSVGRPDTFYPSPFFDIGHTYLPPSTKALLRWCRYYYLTNPLINSVIHKMSEYPITEIVIDERDANPRRWSTGPFFGGDWWPRLFSDADFWRLSATMSEEGGTFHSDNFISNEGRFQVVIPELVSRVKPGGVYVGVGPEQNFTYIAAVRARLAFIVDIRRGNLLQHLLYKALFELSADRAEFAARLFSRPRPATLSAASTADEIFTALRAPSTARRCLPVRAIEKSSIALKTVV